MSLVVARRIGDDVSLIGDTHLKNDYGYHAGWIEGVAKVMVLRPDLAFGFAGDVAVAESAIKSCTGVLLSGSWQEFVLKLLEVHKQSSAATDFIVVKLDPIDIVQIKNGYAESVDFAWIGDHCAFNAFQSHLGSIKGEIPRSSMLAESVEASSQETAVMESRLLNAMHAVIDDRSIDSVAGFALRISSFKRGFRYAEYLKSMSGHIDVDTLKYSNAQKRSFGTAEGGHYTVYSTSCFDHLRLYPILFWPEASMGVLFHAGDGGLYRPYKIYAKSFDEFLCAVRDVSNCLYASPLLASKGVPALMVGLKNQIKIEKGGRRVNDLDVVWNQRVAIRTVDGIVFRMALGVVDNDVTDRVSRALQVGRPVIRALADGRIYSLRDLFREMVFERNLHIKQRSNVKIRINKTKQGLGYVVFLDELEIELLDLTMEGRLEFIYPGCWRNSDCRAISSIVA